MNPLSNGTLKRVMAGLGIAVVVFLASQILINSNRITALEVRMESIERAVDDCKFIIETVRVENREEHRDIESKLDRALELLKR